jgi:hypothetical protein
LYLCCIIYFRLGSDPQSPEEFLAKVTVTCTILS